MENKYWLLEPSDSFLDINQDDIDMMKWEAGLELEPDCMTLAKAKKEQDILDRLKEKDNE